LKNISKLITEEPEFKLEIEDMNKLEDEIIKKYCQENQSKLNSLIPSLLNALSLEKQEDENSQTFALRLFNEFSKTIEK
jgi:hypothetical protein